MVTSYICRIQIWDPNDLRIEIWNPLAIFGMKMLGIAGWSLKIYWDFSDTCV